MERLLEALVRFRARILPSAWGGVPLLVAVVTLTGCGSDSVEPQLPEVPEGAQLDPYVLEDMRWRIMLRHKFFETPYGSFNVQMHNLLNIKVASQSPPGPDGVVTTLLGCRYRMEDGMQLSLVFELKWSVANIVWAEGAGGKKWVSNGDYTVRSIRLVSATPVG